ERDEADLLRVEARRARLAEHAVEVEAQVLGVIGNRGFDAVDAHVVTFEERKGGGIAPAAESSPPWGGEMARCRTLLLCPGEEKSGRLERFFALLPIARAKLVGLERI